MDGGIGTLTISQSFHIFSSSAVTYIRVDSTTSFSKIDVGYAVLAAELYVEKHPDYKPPRPTVLPIITAGSGVQGKFDILIVTNSPWSLMGPPPVTYTFLGKAEPFEYDLYVETFGRTGGGP